MPGQVALGHMSVPTAAERAIRRRIARHGPITLAEYMARALYGPGGYYTRHGAGTDYYTSPQVHPAFGALLAVQLFRFWQLLNRPDPFFVIEPGAGDGQLGRDICNAAAYLPDGFPRSLRYVAGDRRAAGRIIHSPTPAGVVCDALRMPFRNVTGCIISNELLDALPVHRVRLEHGSLRELYVGVQSDVADGYEGQFVEVSAEPSTPALQSHLSDIGVHLSEGQSAEICLLLDDWAASVASALDRGFVLTIDYGRGAHDLYDPVQRPHGTLVTYRSHRQTDTPFVDPGRQDITAQVDFTSVQMASERAGLTTVDHMPQGRFLTRLGLQTIRRNASPPESGGSGWVTIPINPDGLLPDALPDAFGQPPDDSRDWLTGLTHLARPGGLGDFQVLVQSKGIPADPSNAALSWLDDDATPNEYSPSALAAMIPAEALALGPERFRLAGPAML